MTKKKIGIYLELYDERCNISNLTVWDISGINREKEFFEPSKQVGYDTSSYKIVPPNYFACNLMHVGRDEVLPISINHTKKNKIVSPAYTVFKITTEKEILKEYFFVMLKSDEKDRFFWFNTDSSVRDGMSWEAFCDLEIDLPPPPIQRKYIDVYDAMLANQRAYERGLEDLKLTCDAYIERLRRDIPLTPIGNYIKPRLEKNSKLEVKIAQGVNTEKFFVSPKQIAEDKKNAQIVRTGQFAYNMATTRNGDKISIAYRVGCDCVVSSAYQVFEIVDKNELLPEYLMIWFRRSEFDRYVRYHSWGSAHEFFTFDDMCHVEFPIPDIQIQQAIVTIYNSYLNRREINKTLKKQIKDICPILIKGSIEEAKRTQLKEGSAWS